MQWQLTRWIRVRDDSGVETEKLGYGYACTGKAKKVSKAFPQFCFGDGQ
jgi:hypothetical protein